MDNTVILDVKLDGVEEATKKAAQLADKIKEAKTLAGELTSMLDDIKLDVDSQHTEHSIGINDVDALLESSLCRHNSNDVINENYEKGKP